LVPGRLVVFVTGIVVALVVVDVDVVGGTFVTGGVAVVGTFVSDGGDVVGGLVSDGGVVVVVGCGVVSDGGVVVVEGALVSDEGAIVGGVATAGKDAVGFVVVGEELDLCVVGVEGTAEVRPLVFDETIRFRSAVYCWFVSHSV
jgi:hypothetical protein